MMRAEGGWKDSLFRSGGIGVCSQCAPAASAKLHRCQRKVFRCGSWRLQSKIKELQSWFFHRPLPSFLMAAFSGLALFFSLV